MSSLKAIGEAVAQKVEAEINLKRTLAEAAENGIPIARIMRASGYSRPTVERWIREVQDSEWRGV